jgi:acyl-coenzyme A thioesterase PaaI-like protein
MKSLQQQYGPNGHCFGCGPKNDKGLQIESYAQEDGSIQATFSPQPHHEAFDGVVNGGIVGALMDCHSNWTAAYGLMQAQKLEELPWTVTAEFHVKLLAPTPSDQTLTLKAWVTDIQKRKVWVRCELWAHESKVATCDGLFMAVREDHPAYRRWQ